MALTLEQKIKGDFTFKLDTSMEDLELIRSELKTEFIGIDEEIDQLIDNIKPWMFFRNTLTKPHIINLVGMTGTGKTDLVSKLFDKLELKNILFRINGSKLNSTNPLDTLANMSLYNRCKYPIIFLDEFQHYRSLDEDGADVKNYNSELWDFIDDGKLESSRIHSSVGDVGNSVWRILLMLIYFKNNTYKNGTFRLSAEEYEKVRAVSEYDEINESEKVEFIKIKDQTIKGYLMDELLSDLQKVCVVEAKEKYTQYTFAKNVYDYVNDLFLIYNIEQGLDIKALIQEKSYHDVILFFKLIKDNLLESGREPEMNYSKSQIITAFNLDEAYDIADNFNPDMSADELYKISKKINIVKVKESLQKRFRNEQIARLGNTFIIYKTLNSDSYKKIIQNQLTSYSKYIGENFGINLVFDKSVNNIIYREGVYPTLGVRMTISTINDLIKGTFASTLVYQKENKIEADTVVYSYKKQYFYAQFYKRSAKTGNTRHKLTIRLDKYRENRGDDAQAMVAVHEAGHVVSQIVNFNYIPVEVRSVTSNYDSMGFVWPGVNDEFTIRNKEYIDKQVMLYLGGRAAENITFEKNMISEGASGDIVMANHYLFNEYRSWGLGGSLLVRELSPFGNSAAKEFEKDTIQEEVDNKLNELLKKTEELLKTENVLLYKMAQYLSNHPSMNQKMILKYVKLYGKTIDTKTLTLKYDNSRWGYRKKLNDTLKKLI